MTDIGRSAGVSKASHETSEIQDLQVCPGLADMLQEPGRSSWAACGQEQRGWRLRQNFVRGAGSVLTHLIKPLQAFTIEFLNEGPPPERQCENPEPKRSGAFIASGEQIAGVGIESGGTEIPGTQEFLEACAELGSLIRRRLL